MVYDGEESQSRFDCSIAIGSIAAYDRAVELINCSPIDVVSLQHEFGIYGGIDGGYVVHLAEEIKKPIVLTLHTTHGELSPSRRQILKKLAGASKLVVVLTEESAHMVASHFDVPKTKIRVIRHGIPCVDFTLPLASKYRNDLSAPLVFVSAGHLRPAKGYDIALKALAKYRTYNPQFKYLILGTIQPQSNKGGNEYRIELTKLIRQLNLEDKVIWIDRYLNLEDLLQYVRSADIGLVTYTRPYQSSSGILPLILGCGRLAIATDFNYAESIVEKVEGIRLARMNDPDSVFDRICEISQNRSEMHALMHSNYLATRDWLWENAAARYAQVFSESLA